MALLLYYLLKKKMFELLFQIMNLPATLYIALVWGIPLTNVGTLTTAAAKLSLLYDVRVCNTFLDLLFHVSYILWGLKHFIQWCGFCIADKLSQLIPKFLAVWKWSISLVMHPNLGVKRETRWFTRKSWHLWALEPRSLFLSHQWEEVHDHTITFCSYH